MSKVQLANFSSDGFDKGANSLKIFLWYFVNALFVRPAWNPFIGLKVFFLKLFGAKIGNNLCIKNEVRIKFPWKLSIGDDCWIGECVWIDNLDYVTIGNNVCISQGALLLTGNHNYKRYDMPYRNAPIIINDGAWIGANSTVCSGVVVGENAVLTVSSMTSKNLEPNWIYQGVPAGKVRLRTIEG